jgi:hypothetical protein
VGKIGVAGNRLLTFLLAAKSSHGRAFQAQLRRKALCRRTLLTLMFIDVLSQSADAALLLSHQ